MLMAKVSLHYESKKVLENFEEKKDPLLSISPYSIPEFMTIEDIEYSQTRSTYAMILSIICRF